MPVRHDAIFEWKMTPPESAAYKLAVIYEEEFLKTFSGPGLDGQTYRRNTISKRGDPRKSNLFRYCWKLRRETRGLLEPEQYRQYIRAQFVILKKNKAHVEPNAICGEKAWIRWKVYERWYNRKLAEKNCEAPPPSASRTNPKVVKEIDKTKRFLFEKFEGDPTQEKLKRFIDEGIFKFWVMTGKISPFYIVLSPHVEASCDLNELAASCSFDPTLMREKVTDEVREYFNHEYKHEFSDSNVGS